MGLLNDNRKFIIHFNHQIYSYSQKWNYFLLEINRILFAHCLLQFRHIFIYLTRHYLISWATSNTMLMLQILPHSNTFVMPSVSHSRSRILRLEKTEISSFDLRSPQLSISLIVYTKIINTNQIKLNQIVFWILQQQQQPAQLSNSYCISHLLHIVWPIE